MGILEQKIDQLRDDLHIDAVPDQFVFCFCGYAGWPFEGWVCFTGGVRRFEAEEAE